MKEPIIISLGGSLIAPKQLTHPDHSYLTRLKDLITYHVNNGKTFFLITGGGKLARDYQQAGSVISNLDNVDLDWLGIYATRLNAQLVRFILHEYSYPNIITDPTLDYSDLSSYSVAVAAGWHPGNSTDYIAVKLAQKYSVKKVINLSNIDYVYTQDPNLFPEAEIIQTINWADFRMMVGETWEPGSSAPFDPIASKEAEKSNLSVAIMNGANIENLHSYLLGEDFEGTIIE